MERRKEERVFGIKLFRDQIIQTTHLYGDYDLIFDFIF